MNNFHDVTSLLEQALSGISYEKLHMSDEVKEQVHIHHLTFLPLLVRFAAKQILFLFSPEFFSKNYADHNIEAN